MGINPFKALKGITKPFKKILRSPIGKAAGLAALFYGAPMMGGYGAGGAGWKKMLTAKAPWLYAEGVPGVANPGADPTGILTKALGFAKKHPYITAGGTAMAAGALGDDVLEESKTVIDDTGHKGYLKAREMNLDEWAKWAMDQDDTLTYEEALEKVSDPLFNKAQGGLISLARGGRIGLQGGSHRGGFEETQATGKSYEAAKANFAPGPGGGADNWQNQALQQHKQQQALKSLVNKQEAEKNEELVETLRNKQLGEIKSGSALVDAGLNIFKGPFQKGMTANRNFFIDKVLPAQKGMFKGQDLYGMSDEDQEELYQNWLDQRQSGVIDAYGNLKSGYSKEQIPHTDKYGNVTYKEVIMSTGAGEDEWKRSGHPSYDAWVTAQGGGGGGGGAGTSDTTGDYYGFKEWEDWAGAPTTPLFGDTTKYKALLNRGGRIGLYAGGMGAMNSPMNPMMNQGLGAMGSQGMNPYNQQNLMQQAQMRGQPQGRPPMPGGPTTAQGPGLASLPKQTDDNELLQLIKMLASMGIPMEQLRGRTKEELVEMVMSLSSKAQAQRGGGEEVVEEQEEVVEAAHGGRIHAAGGLGEDRFGRHKFLSGIQEEEEEEIYIPRAQGGLTRSRYAMGTEQPIIPSRDGPQIDYRGIGGYQPHGAKEKKDDVRALLAQGEFVVTSDAVKGIGDGDRDVGAKRMYDMMHKYEPIGRALS